jgi:hypothetical protein
MSSRKYAVLLMLVLMAMPLFGAGARRGWSKIEVTPLDGKSVPSDLLGRFGAEVVADFGSYSIGYAPSGAVEALKRQGAQEHVRVEARDELDHLRLPGGDVDVREGIQGVPAAKLSRGYAAGKPGVFVLQFSAPARKEWVAELQALGWTLSRYIPNDGYLVVGPPELAAQTRNLAYVQWLDFYHPYQKAAFLPGDGASHDLLFELPAGSAAEAGVEAIRAAAEGAIDVQRGSLDTLVYARMGEAAARQLLQHPMILSAGVKPEARLSDGRQSQSLSPLLNAAGTQPTPGSNYWNWVLANCPECASMPASTWMIGVADTGLDNGSIQFGHPDLDGRKFFGILGYNPAFNPDPKCAAGQLLCDEYRHGTLVSGMAAGNGSAQIYDSGGFLMGLGGAPTAGIFMTKIKTAITGIDSTRLMLWTADAANNGATIQNHSWESTADAGLYDSLSRQFDIAARDSDGATTSARIPILLTVAAGNDDNGTGNKTSPVGMAKNVLTLGGLENYRPEADAFNCRGTKGDSFMNIMRTSRTGTGLAGYVKPDLMAPASVIVSTATSIWWPDNPTTGYCLANYENSFIYSGDSGTSFAAPLGAAASIVVKRYLGNAPGDTSPALIKATLIAGARSVRGGEDRSKNPAIPIGAVPSQQQGFGRLTLEDILNGAQKPVFFDQSPTRLFTQAGQTFCSRLKVRDVTKPVKIALVWTDTPATAFVPNPLVNNLNLEVRRNSSPSTVYAGNSLAVTANGEESVAYPSGGTVPFDNVNNVEYFRSFMTANEQFSVTVRAANIAGDTDGNLATFEQDYALVILNADLVSVGSCDTPPTATFTVTCSDLICTANGSASSDDFGITNYGWNWGDGQTTNTAVATTSHTYGGPGTFNVVLTTTDTAGQSTTSTPRAATACNPLGIATQPASQTITPGSTATLTVAASGSGAFSYQWYEGTSGTTTTPVGANSSSFTTPVLGTTKSYWVRITSACNVAHSINSATATITVTCTAAPAISVQPASGTVTAGQPVTLTVTASQAASYQWYQGTAPSIVNPIGANSSSLTVSPSATTSYWVRVSNSCGTVDSTTATITVCNPPTIATQPASTTIPSGSTATLNVVAGGSGPFSYQWYEGASGTTTTPVGSNSASFTTPVLTTNKSYWVRVTSTCNGTASVNSNTAVVTVTCTVAPSITVQPTPRTINAGQPTTLTVTANSAGTTTYQWYQGTAPVTTNPVGTNSSSLTVTPPATTSYWVRISNGCGSVDSTTAVVTVCAPPSIATQPASTTITSGQSATLTVAAGGSGPFTYQWYDGTSGVTTTPVGTNSSSFTTPALSATKSYWVRLTSTCNGTASVNSNTATVTVLPPQITRRQAAFSVANSQTSITATWPQPTVAGTLLVAVISSDVDTGGSNGWTAPAGWVQAGSQAWTNLITTIYYLPNNAGGRTTETFTVAGGFHDQVLNILEYSGAALTNVLDKTAANGNGTNTGTIDSGFTAATAQPKEVVVTGLSTYTPTSFSSPTNGFVEVSDHFIGNHLTTAVHELITTSTGATGHSASTGGGQQWTGLVATFRSANPN